VTLAGITSLMRAPIGDIVAAGAADVALALQDECTSIAAAHGYPPRASAVERLRAAVTAPGSPLTASMFRDIEAKRRTEEDHIVGDLLRRADASHPTPVRRVVQAHRATY